MYAVQNRHFELVSILCEKECSLDLRNNDNMLVCSSALVAANMNKRFAFSGKYYDILRLQLFPCIEEIKDLDPLFHHLFHAVH